MTISQSNNMELVEVLLITQAMLASAEAGDWSVVASLQRQRQILLEKFVADETDIGRLQEILDSDAKIATHGTAARKTLERAWDDVRNKREALTAYGRAKRSSSDSA